MAKLNDTSLPNRPKLHTPEMVPAERVLHKIESRLQGVKCALSCATDALGITDAANSDEGVARVERTLQDLLQTLEAIQVDLDRFSGEHLREPLLQAVRS